MSITQFIDLLNTKLLAKITKFRKKNTKILKFTKRFAKIEAEKVKLK